MKKEEIQGKKPSRVKIRSTGDKTIDDAGTNEPICANMTERQVWRINVDFPPMLGPGVIIAISEEEQTRYDPCTSFFTHLDIVGNILLMPDNMRNRRRFWR